MATYVPPKKNTAYVIYIGLPSVADTTIFQANPTLATGDFKVSKDGGALANLTTLPTVSPASGKLVAISLSATEMDADNVVVIASDASGAEWMDAIVSIQTSARQIDDLAYPTTSGRSIDVTTGGEVGIDWANIGSPTTSQTLSSTTVGTATTIGTTGLAAIWDRLTSALSTSGSVGKLVVDNLDAAISSRASQTSLDAVDDYVDTEVAAIKAKTDNLPAAPAATSDIPSAATIAAAVWAVLTSTLTTASTIGKLLVDNLNATISSRASQTSLDTVAGYVDTEVAAIKAKTDNLPTDPADASDIAASFSSLSGQVTAVDTVVDAIQVKTDNLPASPAATGDIPSASTIAAAVLDEAITEPGGVFAWGSATLRNIVGWLGALSRNKMLQTATTTTLRNDADGADLATSGVNDDGTTFTKDEWS